VGSHWHRVVEFVFSGPYCARYAFVGADAGPVSAAPPVPAAATTVYVVYELMPEGDLERHLSHPAPTAQGAPGGPGLTDLERLTVRRRFLLGHIPSTPTNTTLSAISEDRFAFERRPSQ
jgi:hypothetical protein